MKLMNNLSVETILESYKKQGFDKYQLEFLEKCLNDGIEVSQFANKDYTVERMKLLCNARKKGIDISLATQYEFTIDQMQHIISGLELGVDVSIYALPKYRATQMTVIKRVLHEGLDLDFFLDENVPFTDLWYEYTQLSNAKRRGANAA